MLLLEPIPGTSPELGDSAKDSKAKRVASPFSLSLAASWKGLCATLAPALAQASCHSFFCSSTTWVSASVHVVLKPVGQKSLCWGAAMQEKNMIVLL